MFSKSETEFLKGSKNVNDGYARYLRHSIKRKLEQFRKEAFPIMLGNSYTRTWMLEAVREIANTVRENPNTYSETILNRGSTNQDR